MDSYVDVAIVGAGVIGSSIAYHLALEGVQVGVWERAAPAVSPAASWASAGGVRSQGRDHREWSVSLEASRRWPHLADELGADTGFVAGGHLHLALSQGDFAELQASVAAQVSAGIQVSTVSGSDVQQIVPTLAPCFGAAFSPGDGQANPRLTTHAFVQAAIRHGARFHLGSQVMGLLSDDGRVVGLDTDKGTVGAERVVLAAGAWSGALATSAGLRLPVRVQVPQMILTEPGTPGQLRPTISAAGEVLSLKQLTDGAFLVGGGWPADIDGDGYRLRPESLTGSLRVASAIMPAVQKQAVAEAWAGLEAETIDGVPLLGPLSEHPGLFLALGFSGHGFQLSPAVGRVVAESILSGEDVIPEGLAADRLHRLVAEKTDGLAAMDPTHVSQHSSP